MRVKVKMLEDHQGCKKGEEPMMSAAQADEFIKAKKAKAMKTPKPVRKAPRVCPKCGEEIPD